MKPNQRKPLEECHEHIYVLEILFQCYYREYNVEVKTRVKQSD